MNKLEDIIDYYKAHFAELAEDKQFHFASRLSAWNNDDFCRNYLEENTAKITHDRDYDLIKSDLQELIVNPPPAKINAAETRQEYFDKYPALRGRMLALFRVRHLLTIYKVDARDQFLALCPIDELRDLSTALQQDHAALKTLSTYAINYIYLVDYILFPQESNDSFMHTIHELGEEYDITDAEQIQLLIYLYTHCIIGDANFYAQAISEKRRAIYLIMLERLESIISGQFKNINLDNKLEFLVCCRILNFESSLFDAIYAECSESLSPNGTFVVDTINSYSQSNKISFSDSEHRNVLFIMSKTPYKLSLSFDAK